MGADYWADLNALPMTRMTCTTIAPLALVDERQALLNTPYCDAARWYIEDDPGPAAAT